MKGRSGHGNGSARNDSESTSSPYREAVFVKGKHPKSDFYAGKAYLLAVMC